VDCFGEAEARQCAALQEIGVETDGQLQRLLTVMVQSDGADGESLILALPHGLLFPAGVQVSVDGGAATPVTVQTSDVSGAYGGATLTPELAASMRAGTQMQVSFASVDQERMAVPVTLTGFSAAYDMRQQGVATPADVATPPE
jgi:invasion protein IalB